MKRFPLAGVYSFGEYGRTGLSLSYLDFGDFEGRDVTGVPTGTFSASSYALTGHYATYSGPFTLGASLSFARESIDSYGASALLGTLSALYEDKEENLQVGAIVKNVGVIFGNNEFGELPIDVRLGVSYRLKYLPVRLSLAAHNLQTWDLVYLDTTKSGQLSLDGQQETQEKSFGDQLLRHFSFGAEIFLTERVQLFTGYDHLTRREMKLPNELGTSGFSVGGQVETTYFSFLLGHAWHHNAGGFTRFAIHLDIKQILGDSQPR